MRLPAAFLLFLTAPAAAAEAVALPEPSGLSLFGLGLAGLAMGRWLGMRARGRGSRD
ncbi:PEP-CTERM sorting domain-containing protein [Altererythrobacter marinus]|jgi:hypothetical protein|uniref:PEP-CTERM sorting domain-containing protein n=1 Tax=Pelagerythrobacter marinus TaxID=538382 RepID=A0ABW9UZS9_9SPHN|nr:PEP-CTERM sorting domain-containing protein [Pelagerythrobacter marinus]MXO69357.1 PEP-CTERM sorting domain-containing protein [Pelagerythrobacter marinus]